MSSDIRSELSPEYLGLIATNPFFMNNSSSRLQMFGSHIGQSLIVKGATRKRIQSGLEREYSKYTFSKKMPCNANIIKILQKYPNTLGMGSIRENPLTVIIYENMDTPTREIGIIEIPKFHCIHQYYGFSYKAKNALINITPGSMVPKGTILADSPAVTDDGDYTYGLETNVVMMSLHHIIEDAVVISESYAKRLTTKGYGTRTISWGKNRYPVNIYGTLENPKVFPDIGERIRPDGLLMALREYDDLLAVVDMTPQALMVTDYIFDKTLYGEPNAKIVDIIIHKGNSPRECTPLGLSDQPLKYHSRTIMFYEELLKEYNSLKKKRGDKLVLTPEAHRFVTEAMAVVYDDSSNRIQHTFNRNPLDEWRVTIVFEFDVAPVEGAKLTDLDGGKGVVVSIWPDENMPVDKWGKRAEVIVDGDATIKRMNIGRLYEQALNAANEYVRMVVAQTIQNSGDYKAAWDILDEYYQMVSPPMYALMMKTDIRERIQQHVDIVIKDGIYIYLPTDTPKNHAELIGEIMDKYPDLMGPVIYKNSRGETIQTQSDILIGSMYMLLLEKTGNVWAAVDSSKLQHFGIPAKLTNEDKYSAPGRENPVRVFGESEVRSVAAIAGGDLVADILDQTNNPLNHKVIVDNILRAPQPTNIQKIIDRNDYPIGNGRMQTYVKHFFQCAGVKFVRTKD